MNTPKLDLKVNVDVRDAMRDIDALVEGRGKDYGHPWDDFTCVQGMWEVLVDHRRYNGEVVPDDVEGMCMPDDYDKCVDHVIYMLLVKIARLAHSPRKRDTIQDIAGYAKTLEMCLDRDEGKQRPSVVNRLSDDLKMPSRHVTPTEGPTGIEANVWNEESNSFEPAVLSKPVVSEGDGRKLRTVTPDQALDFSDAEWGYYRYQRDVQRRTHDTALTITRKPDNFGVKWMKMWEAKQ